MADAAVLVRVRTITILEDGVLIEYMLPAVDVYRDGLTFNHQVFLPDDEYDEITHAIRREGKRGVAVALERMQDPKNLIQAPVVLDDDDEIGPYEYPGTGSETETST